MKICVAQTKPIKGDIKGNIKNHLKFIDWAITNRAEIIIFPELSLTGYEPALADALATNIDDKRLDVFQQVSTAKKITIGVGIPIRNNYGITISMILFEPNKPRQLYSKKYIHPDEQPFFISGENYSGPVNQKNTIALAICYELSIKEHAENACQRGSEIYIASVSKSADGLKKAVKQLSEIAKKYSMTVLMSNSIGFCDNFESAGQTAIWNNQGELLDQLDSENEGLLILDTITQETFKKTI